MRSALALLLLASPAAAEEIVLGLSRDQVAITATFDGSDILIFGAELNSELEHQTARDTTHANAPLGQRGAWVADHVASSGGDPAAAKQPQPQAQPQAQGRPTGRGPRTPHDARGCRTTTRSACRSGGWSAGTASSPAVPPWLRGPCGGRRRAAAG